MKNLSRFLALSTILTSIAGATVPSPIEREQAMNAGMRYMSSDQDKSTQAQWWSEYQSSNKPIVQYVADISAEKPEAALWFLLTGGKNGFSTKTASPEEQNTLISSMMKIASYVRDKQTTDEGWQVSIQKYDQDQQNVKVLSFMVNELNEKVRKLETASLLMSKDLLNVNKELSDLKLSSDLKRSDLKSYTATMRRDLTGSIEILNATVATLRQDLDESKQYAKQLFSMMRADQETRDASEASRLTAAAEERRIFADEIKKVREENAKQNEDLLKRMTDVRSESAEVFQQMIAQEKQARLDSEARFLQLSTQMEQARLASEADSKRREEESRKQIQELMTLLAAKNGGGNSPISSLSGFPGGFANYDINSDVSSLASTGTSVGGIPRASFLRVGETLVNGNSADVSVASSGAFINRDLTRTAPLSASGSSVSDDGFVNIKNNDTY